MLESQFQSKLKKLLKKRFPDCVVIKNDANCIQGIPDLSVFYKNKWAMLECKKSALAHHQPNQDYYVERFDKMSFSRFVYPENLDDVLDELDIFFRGGD